MIGLAAACAVAARGRTTCVIERLPGPGQEASTYNSGVVHAGIYYARDSLKAVLCVEGRERLYAFCEEHGVPCARCGKLIVAAADQVGALEALVTRGHQRGQAEHRPGDVPAQPGDLLVEPFRGRRHVGGAVDDERAHRGQSLQPRGQRSAGRRSATTPATASPPAAKATPACSRAKSRGRRSTSDVRIRYATYGF